MTKKYKVHKLLREIAQLLVSKKVIEHPCNVGIVQFNPDTLEAQYVSLFTDWQEPVYHYAFPVHEFVSRTDDFLKKTYYRKLKSGKKPCFPDFAAAHTFLDKDNPNQSNRISFIQRVAIELKKVVFHFPVTQELYCEAQKKERRWAGSNLWGNVHYINILEDRSLIEEAKGHSGHWDYGLVLEKFFLCVDRHSHYVEYFVRTTGKNVLLIAAACSDDSQVARFGDTLDSLDIGKKKRLGFYINPFVGHNMGDTNILSRIRTLVYKKMKNRQPQIEESLHTQFQEVMQKVQLCDDLDNIRTISNWINHNSEYQYYELINFIKKTI